MHTQEENGTGSAQEGVAETGARPTAAQHTPGPWRAIRSGVLAGSRIYQSQSALSAMSEADAHLIAAAPDLLKALKGVVRIADRKTVEFDAARRAIAKAEGSSAGLREARSA